MNSTWNGQFGGCLAEQPGELVSIETVFLAAELAMHLRLAATRSHGLLGFVGTQRDQHRSDPLT